MKLFNISVDPARNLLPFDGKVRYLGKIFSNEEADSLLNSLLKEIDWRNDEVVLFGKKIVTKRKVAWYADKQFSYSYSNTTRLALPWSTELLGLKEICEQKSGRSFNSCLLNLYHSGEEGMAWHSDAEKELERDGTIASLSLGAERKFCFKHKKSGEKVELILEHGSLLLMEEATQSNWLHRLPPSTKVTQPRVNLTFRNIVNQ